MKYLFLVLLVFPSLVFGETWMQFGRKKTPFTKHNGSVVSATKRTVYAKRATDLTYGGEWVDPPLGSYKILEKYARGDKLLVLIDISDLQATMVTQATIPVTVDWTHSIGRNEMRILKSSKIFNFQEGFNPVKLTEEQGVALKTSWGWRPYVPPPPPVESGATEVPE